MNGYTFSVAQSSLTNEFDHTHNYDKGKWVNGYTFSVAQSSHTNEFDHTHNYDKRKWVNGYTFSVAQSSLTNEFDHTHNSFHNLPSLSNLIVMATCEQVRKAGLLMIYQVCCTTF